MQKAAQDESLCTLAKQGVATCGLGRVQGLPSWALTGQREEASNLGSHPNPVKLRCVPKEALPRFPPYSMSELEAAGGGEGGRPPASVHRS